LKSSAYIIDPKPSCLRLIDAADSLGLPFGSAERWQQQSGKNRDDRDYNQQFDQGEAAAGRCVRRV